MHGVKTADKNIHVYLKHKVYIVYCYLQIAISSTVVSLDDYSFVCLRVDIAMRVLYDCARSTYILLHSTMHTVLVRGVLVFREYRQSALYLCTYEYTEQHRAALSGTRSTRKHHNPQRLACKPWIMKNYGFLHVKWLHTHRN